MKKLSLFLWSCLIGWSVAAQSFRFAHVTDTHIGGATAAEDLTRTVNDINAQPDIAFVLFTGDITEFGSGEELLEARRLIAQLNKPYYVLPGNHDSKWSESGCNSFVRIFGAESFTFEKEGILFIGTASGPNMRMAPGLVPREQIVFLDSVLKHRQTPQQPIIFVNHYPLDESLSNWYEVIDRLKSANIQATLLGHGHANRLFNFEGIPGIMGRSNLRAKNETGGYNLATVAGDTLFYAERIPGVETRPVWCKVPLGVKNFENDTIRWPRPDYGVNKTYPQAKPVWAFQEKSDVGTAIVTNGKTAFYGTASGEIVAISAQTGQPSWRFQTGGKIFSTPAIAGNRVICASTDHHLYCLNLKNGSLVWKFATTKPVVASPAVSGKMVFCGASDGIFRALDLHSGKLIWQFDCVKNFVETRPLVYDNGVCFGSWGNTFYALDQKTGQLRWKREKYANRMLSPAAVWPVAANGKIFIVAPDRRMTALDAKTGREIWDSGQYSCRESIGISADGKLVYIKNMNEGQVDAFYTHSGRQELAWECKADLGYEIAPSPITENGNLVLVPTTAGTVVAIDRNNAQVAWKHKISNALVNYIAPLSPNRILVTTLDGWVVCIEYS